MEDAIKLIKELYEEKIELLKKENEILNGKIRCLKSEIEKLKQDKLINELDTYHLEKVGEIDIEEYHSKILIKTFIKNGITDMNEWQRITILAKRIMERKNNERNN